MLNQVLWPYIKSISTEQPQLDQAKDIRGACGTSCTWCSRWCRQAGSGREEPSTCHGPRAAKRVSHCSPKLISGKPYSQLLNLASTLGIPVEGGVRSLHGDPITHLLPCPQTVIGLVKALVVGDAVLAVDEAATSCQWESHKAIRNI